ncbi:competence protein ComEC [Roseiarcus fermentans]|uniref:Competence protein ComEC n=1 Tax=Roseiarcus fermentans TaxID=1473586 RepID=A0A366F3L1_9HYPH|nr:ComEC/Rec2 family competence protein [Roseiarcus fermentans]RBP08570.1 competence protein ComEC [Roseiarcus fermentans]
MSTSGRSGVLTGVAGLSRASSWAVGWRAAFDGALAREVEERRFFLWLPVAAMGGVALNLAADSEPALWAPAALTLVFAGLAFVARSRPIAFGVALALAALFGGFLAMSLRTARVAAPVLDRIRIVSLEGAVEEVDLRTVGARLVIAVSSADGMPAEKVPRRVRVTTRKAPGAVAGDFVALKARLLPPSHAALPGGYDFARDAFFAGVGAVGSTLGAIEILPPPQDASLRQRFAAAIDRARNRLAVRVDRIIGGDEGAIAAAMVTGKRDFLSNDAKDLIREAGIFHIITISGVQMTLVAGIVFFVTRRLLALSPTLALNHPIKKWAAVVAMAGSLFYDIATGSRVGTERALVMTLIVLGAVVLDRRALTMRNLAFAVFAVIAIEPEAIMGVSFQLSFAAVAALVAVMEARLSALETDPDPWLPQRGRPPPRSLLSELLHRPQALLLATACATSATASFMAYHFHDLSPYVLVGNPLTLTIIEFFAVPGALLGTALYPLGLDAPVWLYVGLGIKFILWVAGFIAAAPASTVHLRAFAPFALPFLALAVLSATIWRTWLFRATAIPFAIVGLIGALDGPRFDVIVAPSGEQAAVRDADGRLMIVGKRFNAFAAEQWLTADGDGREPAQARDPNAPCDRLGCVAALPEGEFLSLVLDRLAFDEDCSRAEIVVSSLTAPGDCGAKFVFDERALARLGAVGLTWSDDKGFALAADRTTLQNRPWSPAPAPALDDRIVRPGRGTHGAEPGETEEAAPGQP